MDCKDCKYAQIKQYAEDDFELECEPLNGVCPYLTDWLEQVKESAKTGKPNRLEDKI